MEAQPVDQIKYPIGEFLRKEQYAPNEIEQMISAIEQAPDLYRAIAQGLSENDLKKCYRSGSWTVMQLVHHVADIQLLHFFRMKKALTESDYHEVSLINMDGWVTTPDVTNATLIDSLEMLKSITHRYVSLLKSLTEQQLSIAYFHPVRKYSINQAQAIAMSEWHLKHHLAHIQLALSNPI